MSDKFMPPKPQFKIPREAYWGLNAAELNQIQASLIATEGYFNCQIEDWYDKEIKPLFENAVEVIAGPGLRQSSFEHMAWEQIDTINLLAGTHTHEALLINVKPIKEESAEDILRELLGAVDHNEQEVNQELNTKLGWMLSFRGDIIAKARAYLERKKGK